MPRCPSCTEHVCPEGLKEVGGKLACCECRQLKLVPGTEAKMSELKSAERDPQTAAVPKKLVDIQLFEVSTEGGIDHQISASIRTGGISLNYSTTFDAIRKFFTERRRRVEESKKKSVA